MFPDAKLFDLEILKQTPAYLLKGKKTHLGHGGEIFGGDVGRAYKLEKANMLLICYGGSLAGYYHNYPDTDRNPVLGKLKQRGFCAVVTEYPAKKYINGRNIFSLALVNNGEWLPRADYKHKGAWSCISTTYNSYYETCFSKMMTNGWQMDY